MNGREELKKLSPWSGEVLFDEPLAKHTSIKIGGPASALVFPTQILDLQSLATWILKYKPNVAIFGLGSNLLTSDDGFDGVVIKTLRLATEISLEDGGIRTGAGVSVATFLRRAASEGWDGFERISGIPGTLGGVVVMNGGTHLGEAKDLLLEVRTFDLLAPEKGVRSHSGSSLAFQYRKNLFLRPSEIVVDALWRKKTGDPTTIRDLLDGLYRRRKETQPLDFPSCGSVFKNPEKGGIRAWEVVDRLGLRGHRIGNAEFSAKHPNWILNRGQASAGDVLALIELAKTRALSELGIELIEEVKTLSRTGGWTPTP